ncbi:hypothetical protein Dfri01_65790 [Dyadobacter frigoris]|nr:hypothetical protein Dfri01_65790 [Dyadobacter frigoris]
MGRYSIIHNNGRYSFPDYDVIFIYEKCYFNSDEALTTDVQLLPLASHFKAYTRFLILYKQV